MSRAATQFLEDLMTAVRRNEDPVGTASSLYVVGSSCREVALHVIECFHTGDEASKKELLASLDARSRRVVDAVLELVLKEQTGIPPEPVETEQP